MNARIQSTLPPFGDLVEGGYFHGIYLLGASEIWGEVTCPRADGEITGKAWQDKRTDVVGATSDFDGLANTQAMAQAGSPLAEAALLCRAGGHDDWYVPARGGQLLQWANLRLLLPEADRFQPRSHWNSTQFDRYTAYLQLFDDGTAYLYDKSWEGAVARLVRRFRIQ
jgi:hypothetical protein